MGKLRRRAGGAERWFIIPCAARRPGRFPAAARFHGLEKALSPAGPPPQAPDQSVPRRTSITKNLQDIPDRMPERMSEDMPDTDARNNARMNA